MDVAVETKIKTVAANIRKVREYRDYTQDYMAMKLGISQNAYSKIELAYTRITLERLIQIAGILEIDVITLINSTSEDLLKLNTSASSNRELIRN
ncbi:helix-turn-helix domain-containing protein [Dyadobacter sp. CY345]|uniref:helix-turn-helix domain-containing protein n=1 Tax=Dyadobacter sp. CY345 TaxID=2909335 RepID=UPI001F31A632|nr:helix-turn-helix transcriptional regulator [Dyadobacter sp. CY345]MCF2442972.1 helix-turn-helix domain-containing protein [Dyadobacter sp. CY345]